MVLARAPVSVPVLAMVKGQELALAMVLARAKAQEKALV